MKVLLVLVFSLFMNFQKANATIWVVYECGLSEITDTAYIPLDHGDMSWGTGGFQGNPLALEGSRVKAKVTIKKVQPHEDLVEFLDLISGKKIESVIGKPITTPDNKRFVVNCIVDA